MEIIAGVDEAGRGPLAGPVVAAAVVLSEDHPITGLRDSKKLGPKSRDKFFDLIMESARAVGVGIVDHRGIDRMNILNATHKAMQISLGWLGLRPDKALIDGYGLPNQVIPNEGVIKGDDKIDCIRAASIIAKVTRDRMMLDYDRIFPEYGFAAHKGYGTAQHLMSLDEWKPSPIHRKSFSPVRNSLVPLRWYSENRRIGWLGEKLAALYLVKNGYAIREMNCRLAPHGEIDIVAEQSGAIVFIEVKTGLSRAGVNPELNLNQQKLRKMEAAIQTYVQQSEWQGPIRAEAITIVIQGKNHSIKHWKNVDFDSE